jgi:uncharacterized membrane protein YGL010W
MAEKLSRERKIDGVLSHYSDNHQNSFNQAVQYVCVPLIAFGLLGIIWSVPFPHLDILGRYNGFINWASFLIAFSLYSYYRLSPVLSYGILFMVFVFSAAIVGLEKLHTYSSWPTQGQVCLGIFAIGLIIQFLGQKNERKALSLSGQFKILLNGPIWVMAALFKRLKLPF